MGMVHGISLSYNGRAPFVFFMKKYAQIFGIILPAAGLILYVFLIPPNIGNPATLSIFFVLVAAFFVGLANFLFGPMKSKRRRLVWSGVTGLFCVYLLALGSLNALTVANLSVALFVITAILFLVDRSKI